MLCHGIKEFRLQSSIKSEYINTGFRYFVTINKASGEIIRPSDLDSLSRFCPLDTQEMEALQIFWSGFLTQNTSNH